MSTSTPKILETQSSPSLRQVVEGNLKNRKIQWIPSGSMSGVLAAGTIAAAVLGGPITLIAALAIATLAALATFLASIFLPSKHFTEETQNVEPNVSSEIEQKTAFDDAHLVDRLSDVSEQAEELQSLDRRSEIAENSDSKPLEELSRPLLLPQSFLSAIIASAGEDSRPNAVGPLFQKIAQDCEGLADAVAEQELTKTEDSDEEKVSEVPVKPTKIEEIPDSDEESVSAVSETAESEELVKTEEPSSFRKRMNSVATYMRNNPIKTLVGITGVAAFGAGAYYTINGLSAAGTLANAAATCPAPLSTFTNVCPTTASTAMDIVESLASPQIVLPINASLPTAASVVSLTIPHCEEGLISRLRQAAVSLGKNLGDKTSSLLSSIYPGQSTQSGLLSTPANLNATNEVCISSDKPLSLRVAQSISSMGETVLSSAGSASAAVVSGYTQGADMLNSVATAVKNSPSFANQLLHTVQEKVSSLGTILFDQLKDFFAKLEETKELPGSLPVAPAIPSVKVEAERTIASLWGNRSFISEEALINNSR